MEKLLSTINSNYVILLGFIIFFIAGFIISSVMKKAYSEIKTRQKFTAGEKGEIKAVNILNHNGFSVIKSQPEGKAYMWINGKMRVMSIRADYLVKKGDKQYICEVKTGRVAGDPTYRHTRRQMLEYSLYFRMPIVFVDVINQSVMNIEFAMP